MFFGTRQQTPRFMNTVLVDRLIEDPRYFLETFVDIVDKDRQTVPFIFNASQLKYFREMTLRDIILKPRQLGFSTQIMGLFLHDTMYIPNTTSVIVAQSEKDASDLFSRVRFMFESIDPEFRPKVRYSNRKELLFDKINSWYFVGSAEAKGFGRGKTIQNLHCIHPNVLILGKNGFVNKIKDVGIQTREWEGELISIFVRKNPKQPIIVSPDHLILTKDGWKEAQNITKKDKIAQFKKKILSSISFVRIELENKVNQFVGKEGFVSLPLTKDFGWIVGMFLAEGTACSEGNSITFSLNASETGFSEKIKDFFENCAVGLKVRKHRKNDGEVKVVVEDGVLRCFVYSKTWHSWFRNNFYENPDEGKNKFIPDWVFNCGNDFCKGLVNGCIDGDGSKSAFETNYVSARPQLTYQLRDLICSLGYGWATVEWVKDTEKRKEKPWKFGKAYESCNLRILGTALKRLREEKIPSFSIVRSYKRNHYGKEETIKRGLVKTPRILSAQRYSEDGDFVYQDVWKAEKIYYKGPLYDLINQPNNQFRTVSGIVHNCSEVSLPTWSKDFMDGLLESVPKTGRVVIESTARGEGGLFYDMYFDSKNKDNEFKPHFYRWFEHWEYVEPIPLGMTREEFIESYDWEERELVKKHNLIPEQIQWRRIKKSRLRGKFIQEYPEMDDVDAFIKSGSSIFDTVMLKERDDTLPEQAPHEIWLGGELFLYRIVQPGAKYIISCDTSEGDIYSDYSAAVVTRIWPLPLEQCALLHGRWSPDIFSEKAYKMARAYNYGLIAVERNNHGHAVLLNLSNGIVRQGAVVLPPYPNIYVGPDKKLGWHTGPTSKPQMIDELDRVIRSGELIINSKDFIKEARRFVALKGGAMGVPPAVGNDDIVMAQAVGIVAISGGKFDYEFV